jgi:predicted MFS family arabinose efflux permease
MAVLMSSWPFGISLGLIFLGRLAAATSWQMVMFLTAGACLVSLTFVAVLYPSSSTADAKHPAESTKARFSREEILLVLIASLIWTLFCAFYYGAMTALTTITGFSRDFTQSPAAPLLFGGMLLFAAIIIFAVFRMFQVRAKLMPNDRCLSNSTTDK